MEREEGECTHCASERVNLFICLFPYLRSRSEKVAISVCNVIELVRPHAVLLPLRVALGLVIIVVRILRD